MLLMGLLGASLMGALPFMLQCVIETAYPVRTILPVSYSPVSTCEHRCMIPMMPMSY
jgi:hypothetical protein